MEPVFRSLIPPNLLLGLPWKLCVMLIMLNLILVLELHLWLWIPFGVALFFVAGRAASIDPYFMDIAIAALKLPEELD